MSENPQAGESVDPADFPEEGGPGGTLNQSEGTDSDEVHNDDGDIVVDPPEGWSEANRFGMTAREERDGEPLDDRLAEERPDMTAPEDGESLYEVVDENAAPDFTQQKR